MERGAYDNKFDPKCRDWRKCFARKEGKCTILIQTYNAGECPFAKVRRSDKLSYYARQLRDKHCP